ncbi:hypothetical protein ABT362_26530 [Nonomuraea rubra]|uniref:Uncharacterized protein n=1 Tax=Nonomuraea rubra TaxID=46180 RepID=A0A7X0NZI5_9ACTN|nr:hypothetical protein [Nonomuraea rubra]MBB6552513.1 hypothetical protein [Nonomuraea rubra]
MPPEIESHRSIEYQRVNRGPQQDFTVAKSLTEEGFEVSGLCPECKGKTSTPWPFGIAGAKGLFKKNEEPHPSGPRTVGCECGYAHANRPDGLWIVGCGAYWTVELPQ